MPDDTTPTLTVRIDADTRRCSSSSTERAKLGSQFGNTLVQRLRRRRPAGKGLSDVLRSLALQPVRDRAQGRLQAAHRCARRRARRPLRRRRLRQGRRAAAGGCRSRSPQGGVIASPIAFPLGGNRLGLAGERGAEAILPLARGPDGRLGVRADAGGGVHVTFNVTTPDADSFRRSRPRSPPCWPAPSRTANATCEGE